VGFKPEGDEALGCGITYHEFAAAAGALVNASYRDDEAAAATSAALMRLASTYPDYFQQYNNTIGNAGNTASGSAG